MIYDNVSVDDIVAIEGMEMMKGRLVFFQEQISLEDPIYVENQLKSLLRRSITSVEELELWLLEQAELDDAIGEVLSGNYIAFQRYNQDPEIKARFEHNQEVIVPLLKKYGHLLNEAFYNNPYRQHLDSDKYELMIRTKLNAIELFRERNIPLEVEEDKLGNQYFEITGSATVTWEGEEKTLPQMKPYLQSDDRAIREKAWWIISDKLAQHRTELNELMSELIKLRDQKAAHADMPNYRDYMFKKYERFDYTAEDCFRFHEAVKQEIVPLVGRIQKKHQQELGVESYKPWDTQGVPAGKKALKPFDQASQLIVGSIDIFNQIDPLLGEMLKEMQEGDLLDLESRKEKSPGGFCSELPVTGLSFIFMNAAGTHDDLTTIMHEGGHAFHNQLKKHQSVPAYRDVPMESAELASMSMELFTMYYWDRFYSNEQELIQAQLEHLEGIISFFPWAMVVDRFQHWIYENPTHTVEEREAYFLELAKDYNYQFIDTEGLEEQLKTRWLLQLHIFEVPFYYIEYAIAQLGALQLWQNYTLNPEQTIEQYKKALSLGSSAPLPEVYKAAGIDFDFSAKKIGDLISFVEKQRQTLLQGKPLTL